MPTDASLQLESIRCNNCGAPLAVPPAANYVTCQHCQAQLAIKRTPTASYTEVLEEVTRQTAALRSQVQQLTLQNELAALDRAWDREREGLLIYPKSGAPQEPTVLHAIVPGFAFGALGLFLLSNTAGNTQPLGVFALLGAVLGIGYGLFKSSSYQAAYNRYRQRRDALLDGGRGDRVDPAAD
jgi:DNA-directed RNA polymerase subunit RPC12/RpoP